MASDSANASLVLQTRGGQPSLKVRPVAPAFDPPEVLLEQGVEALDGVRGREEFFETRADLEPVKRQEVILGLQITLQCGWIMPVQTGLQCL